MVHFYKEAFPADSKHNKQFSKYPFPLSDFQKYAIQGLETGKHVLIGAHTGSGKTLPAEYAIERFIEAGKKVIYTAPIKALSNQKYKDFTEKFPHISFGILTGDIKSNPEADCLIMTTEILRNTLFQKKMVQKQDGDDVELSANSALHFDIDIDNELACVVFDEVHYINDPDRGKIWEETIMMLPDSVQMLMLSATIDKPESFAQWIERNKTRDVVLVQTTERVVPLTHYSYITAPDSVIARFKDREIADLADGYLRKLVPIKRQSAPFDQEKFYKIVKLLRFYEKKDIRVNQSFVINDIVRKLKIERMLPAICFILSRKLCDKFAGMITETLFDEGEKSVSIVERECLACLRKLPNYKEYENLPEYRRIVKNIEKGVAVHHSGVLPVFKEMIEMMFAKGFVKLLFATETFAVGVNMPTKTVIFTGFKKFHGSSFRLLKSHEYTQMAGRAGRRGLDTVGHVIHLNNIMEMPLATEMQLMLSGTPESLTSKFKVEYNIILNIIAAQKNNTSTLLEIATFMSYSMMNDEIQRELHHTEGELETLQERCVRLEKETESFKTPKFEIENLIQAKEKITMVKPKQKRRIQNDINTLTQTYKHIERETEKTLGVIRIKKDIENLKDRITNINYYVIEFVKCVNNILIDNGHITVNVDEASDKEKLTVTHKGLIAANLQEVHGLSFAELFAHPEGNVFQALTGKQLAIVFSCFTNIRISDMYRDGYVKSDDVVVKKVIKQLEQTHNKYADRETHLRLERSFDYEISYDMVAFVAEWCDCTNEADCYRILNRLATEKDVFIGEFVKGILKINNIASEFERLCELVGNVELLAKCREIPGLTLKFVATNQSLYV